MVPEHASYIDDLCREVEFLMKEKITSSIRRRIKADVSDPLYEEVVQHLLFCQTKCSTFYGRKEILSRCKAYIQVSACFFSRTNIKRGLDLHSDFRLLHWLQLEKSVTFSKSSPVTCGTVSLTESFKILSLGWYALSSCNSRAVRLRQDFSDVHGSKRIVSLFQPIKHRHSIYRNHSEFLASSSSASQCLSTNLHYLWSWLYQS